MHDQGEHLILLIGVPVRILLYARSQLVHGVNTLLCVPFLLLFTSTGEPLRTEVRVCCECYEVRLGAREYCT